MKILGKLFVSAALLMAIISPVFADDYVIQDVEMPANVPADSAPGTPLKAMRIVLTGVSDAPLHNFDQQLADDFREKVSSSVNQAPHSVLVTTQLSFLTKTKDVSIKAWINGSEQDITYTQVTIEADLSYKYGLPHGGGKHNILHTEKTENYSSSFQGDALVGAFYFRGVPIGGRKIHLEYAEGGTFSTESTKQDMLNHLVDNLIARVPA